MRTQLLVLLALVAMAGCLGFGSDSGGGGSWEYRVVVENGNPNATNLTVTVQSGDVTVNETRQLAPDGRWAVTTLNESTAGSDLSVTVRAGDKKLAEHEAKISSTGAVRIVAGSGVIETCGGSVSCYK